jgi:hypothetical protein
VQGSALAALMLERRQDPRRERWRAAALDQPDQRVQVHVALVRQLLGQRGAEAGLAQPRSAPRDRVGWLSNVGCLAFASSLSAGSGLSAGSRVHAYLAPARGPFLPSEPNPGRKHLCQDRSGRLAKRPSNGGRRCPRASQAAVASSCVV